MKPIQSVNEVPSKAKNQNKHGFCWLKFDSISDNWYNAGLVCTLRAMSLLSKAHDNCLIHFLRRTYDIMIMTHCDTSKYISALTLWFHTSPQSSSNVANLPKEMTYVFWRLRWYTRRPHWPSNQISRVFGLFGLQSWLTSRHVCGHVARATCILRAPVDSPWVVDNVRHWKFSICY